MKKFLTLLVAALFCLTGAAKTAEEVIGELKKATGAMVINFNKEILASQLGKTGDTDLEPIFKNIDNGCVLVLQDADKAKVETFNSKTDELDGSVYEPLTTAFDGDHRVKVLGRAEGDSLKEIVVIVADGSDCVMVCFNGDIPKDKIGQLVNNKTINFN